MKDFRAVGPVAFAEVPAQGAHGPAPLDSRILEDVEHHRVTLEHLGKDFGRKVGDLGLIDHVPGDGSCERE